jgi:FkbM family methyltransferase
MSLQKKGAYHSLGRLLRDIFIRLFPLQVRSVAGKSLLVRDRSELQLYQQIFVKDEFQLTRFRQAVPLTKPMVLDVGANCGFFSIRVLDEYPDATIHSFEPQKRLVTDFQKIITENRLVGHIIAHNAAMGRQEGKAVLYQNRSPISASLVQAKAGKRRVTCRDEVQVHCLNAFLPANGLTKIDILKIDVEGSELDVLEGATEVLNRIAFLFIETHPPFCGPAEVEAFLQKFGYRRIFSLERGNTVDLVFYNPTMAGDSNFEISPP